MNIYTRTGLCLAVLITTACGDPKPPPPPPAAPEPKVDMDQLRREAALRVKAEKDKIRASMSAHGVGKLLKKKLKGDKLEMEFAFENTGEQDLTQAEGNLRISNGAGELLQNMKIPFRMDIKAGKTVKKRGKFPYDPKDPGDKALGATPLSKLKVEWLPTLYRLKDGTELVSD